MDENKRKQTEVIVEDWIEVGNETDIPEDSSVCVRFNGEQVAIYNFTSMGKWFATQNTCPHKLENALSRGLLGDSNGEPKIACPFHKKNFSLESGTCLSGDDYKIKVYPIKIEGGKVLLQLVDK